jgi:hypothetical protein
MLFYNSCAHRVHYGVCTLRLFQCRSVHIDFKVSQISGYLDTWENVSFDDKRRVVDLMITTIAATSDSLNITWKI